MKPSVRQRSLTMRAVAIVVVALTVLSSCASIESELAEDFQKSLTTQGNAYWSIRTVTEAASLVASKQKPLDTIAVGPAQFLQFSDSIVAIWDCSASPDEIALVSGETNASTGATVVTSTREGCLQDAGAVLYVDEYTRSRNRWGFFVARRFGSRAPSGSSFRGRGSGFGK